MYSQALVIEDDLFIIAWEYSLRFYDFSPQTHWTEQFSIHQVTTSFHSTWVVRLVGETGWNQLKTFTNTIATNSSDLLLDLDLKLWRCSIFLKAKPLRVDCTSTCLSTKNQMDIFVIILASLICLCAILHLYTRRVQSKPTDLPFRRFQRRYLIVYLLAAGKTT